MWLAGLAVLAVVGASGLALSALKDQAAFFYAPSDVHRDSLPLGRAVRLGGLVQKGTIVRSPDGLGMHFFVTDGQAAIFVKFRGIAPDLFREGSGVVAEGQFDRSGTFIATNLLAKHDEKYQPPELK